MYISPGTRIGTRHLTYMVPLIPHTYYHFFENISQLKFKRLNLTSIWSTANHKTVSPFVRAFALPIYQIRILHNCDVNSQICKFFFPMEQPLTY